MSAVIKGKLTEAEYLAKEEAADFRSEFYNGEMFAMVGGSAPHNRIIENLSIRIGGKLWGGECQTFSSDMRVKIEKTTLNTYPDFVIVCGKPEYTSVKKLTLINPKVLFEVLSPSNELHDRTTKFEHYKYISTLSEYVLVAQDKAFIESFVRQGDRSWLYRSFEGLTQEFQLFSLNLSLPMAEIFAGVEFSPSPESLRVAYPDAED
jgi:Uma2 family endonuclease